MLRAARVPIRETARTRPVEYKHKTFPSPVRGWVTNENVAASQGVGASVLENFFPERHGIRPRGGTPKYATIHASAPVTAMWAYEVGAVKKFFAATASAIFDVTAPVDATTIPAPVVSGLGGGEWSTALLANVGNTFLCAVNGVDPYRVFDGAAWTTPAITGVASTALSHVWTYKYRLFFVEKNSLRAWCLPTDQIAGAAIEINLAGVFKHGGSVLFGATWSQDAGDGMDDKCVFFSSKGEVAIFSGDYPGSASAWALDGRYDIGVPLGPNSMIRAGGNVIIGTDDGLVPVSASLTQDTAALSLASLSQNIEPDWKAAVRERNGAPGWHMLKWPAKNMAVVALPPGPNFDPCMFVVNLLTNAWAKYTEIEGRCLALFDGQAYFGTADGKIRKLETTGMDNDGAAYFALYVGQYDHLEAPGLTKIYRMARATFTSSKPFRPKLSVSTDYQKRVPAFPSAAPDIPVSTWDNGLWDVALWDGGGPRRVATKWLSVEGAGYSVAPNLQITLGGGDTPDAVLISFELVYENAAVMV